MKEILIFGSTGSIGKNALDVVRLNRKKIKVLGLCAYGNIEHIKRQINEFSPSYVCVVDKNQARKLNGKRKKIKLFVGYEGLEEFSKINCDISLMAISGISGLKPLITSMNHSKRIALANKEAVIAAGSFIFSKAKECNTEIIPVDSEINALFQLLKMRDEYLDKVYITASGGSLRKYTLKKLRDITVKQVLSHPTWKMGNRITVDSATLVNKAFEVIEAHFFFGLPYKDIRVIIHRESAVHALVQFADKAIFACLYPPDMKIPIASALFYPCRVKGSKAMDFKKEFCLTFEPVNYKKYPLLLTLQLAAEREDNSLAILNACDEVAVEYFLKEKIKFGAIYKVMDYMFEHYPSRKLNNLEDVFHWDHWARIKAKEHIDARYC